MNAIISNGDYTASVQLPAERRQLAGALSYSGAKPMHHLPYLNRREFENTVKIEGLASHEQLNRTLR